MIASSRQFEQPRSPLKRWTCDCDGKSDPPVLLAMVDDEGRVEIQARGGRLRWFVEKGTVIAVCPKCGKKHKRTVEYDALQ